MADNERTRRPRWLEFAVETAIRVVGFSSIGFVLLIVLFLLREGVPVFIDVPLDNLFGVRWYPTFDLFGTIPLILGSVLLMIFLTEVASNTASAAIMVPIFLALSHEIVQFSPKTIALSAGIAASCAFMLPVATPPNALVYGTEKVRQRTMIRAGFYLNIIFALVISAVGYFFLR